MSELSSTTSSAAQRWWFPLLPIALAFLGPPAMFVGWNLGYLGLPWFTPLFGVRGRVGGGLGDACQADPGAWRDSPFLPGSHLI